jgi:hypothetical protein
MEHNSRELTQNASNNHLCVPVKYQVFFPKSSPVRVHISNGHVDTECGRNYLPRIRTECTSVVQHIQIKRYKSEEFLNFFRFEVFVGL